MNFSFMMCFGSFMIGDSIDASLVSFLLWALTG